jgi:CBS-domain-containing membrane protein
MFLLIVLHFRDHTLGLPGTKLKKKTWTESVSELYRPRGSRLSEKLVPTFAERACHVVSVTDPCGRILGFIDRVNQLHNNIIKGYTGL